MYIAKSGKNSVVDGVEWDGYPEINLPGFSGDGKRFGFLASSGEIVNTPAGSSPSQHDEFGTPVNRLSQGEGRARTVGSRRNTRRCAARAGVGTRTPETRPRGATVHLAEFR